MCHEWRDLFIELESELKETLRIVDTGFFVAERDENEHNYARRPTGREYILNNGIWYGTCILNYSFSG